MIETTKNLIGQRFVKNISDQPVRMIFKGGLSKMIYPGETEVVEKGVYYRCQTQ